MASPSRPCFLLPATLQTSVFTVGVKEVLGTVVLGGCALPCYNVSGAPARSRTS